MSSAAAPKNTALIFLPCEGMQRSALMDNGAAACGAAAARCAGGFPLHSCSIAVTNSQGR